MKKVTKRLTILLPITVITEVILLIVMVILSISHFSFLSMFLPFSTPWSSNFILDICLKNTICVLAAAIIIIIVQLVSYHHCGERALRYHKKISLILTAVFILVLALAIVLPISRYSYQHVEFSTYTAVEPRANDTELKSDDKNRLPYNDEFIAAGGTDGYIDEYITFGNKYACVFQDGENNMRYICELFQSDSKLLCSKFNAEEEFYPPADAIHGEKDGLEYTAYYEREELAGGWFCNFELAIVQDDAVFKLSVFNTDDVMSENTQALINTAIEQYQLLSR